VNTRSLRFRLLSWYTAWLAVVFLATGALIYFSLDSYLARSLSDLQVRRAGRIAHLLDHPEVSGPELAKEIREDYAPEASGHFVRIYRPDLKVVYLSGAPRDLSFNAALVPPPTGEMGTRWVKLEDGVAMVLATTSAGATNGQQYWVETGDSFGPAERELNQLLVTLLLGAVVLAGVTLTGGLVLVRRALTPVGEVTRHAERISSRNLTERLPVAPTGDELEQLAQALNHMISRLDEAFQHNRRFLADASHELRTPLTILRGELEGMVRAEQVDGPDRERLGGLLEEVVRLTHLVENLFALSRLDAGLAQNPPQIFDLARLAAATCEQMCLLAEDKQLNIQCVAQGAVMVQGDRSRIKQVVVNLLDNAIKYTPAGGLIRLSVFARGTEAVCEVTDNGIGIPPEALPHVFDRFYRVDAARNRDQGGAGIGLSIVKAICLAHGGRVDAESRAGGGSTFRFVLPQVMEELTNQPGLAV
jgi:heavy metal sensor kinase